MSVNYIHIVTLDWLAPLRRPVLLLPGMLLFAAVSATEETLVIAGLVFIPLLLGLVHEAMTWQIVGIRHKMMSMPAYFGEGLELCVPYFFDWHVTIAALSLQAAGVILFAVAMGWVASAALVFFLGLLTLLVMLADGTSLALRLWMIHKHKERDFMLRFCGLFTIAVHDSTVPRFATMFRVNKLLSLDLDSDPSAGPVLLDGDDSI